MLITFEGGEGVGKSTQIQRLSEWLQERHIAHCVTREPGGTPMAERIRDLLMTSEAESLGDDAELLLIAAARAEHLRARIRPMLNQNNWVLCDRFHDSTMAYQGYGRGMDFSRVGTIQQWVLGEIRPDLTVLLDMPADVGLARARHCSSSGDRFDRETTAFHQRVRNGFLTLADHEPDRFYVIDATWNPNRIFQSIVERIQDVFPIT